MKKISALLIVFVVALLVATPVLAAQFEPTGDRLNIYFDIPKSYPANTPFHIVHAWLDFFDEHDLWPYGQFYFELEVDGVYMELTKFVNEKIVDPDTGEFIGIRRAYFFNFPNGMTGTHTFKGHWMGTCYIALQDGLVSECANPMADIELISSDVKIKFK